MRGIRPAAVAGAFYPAQPQSLRAAVQALLATADPQRSGAQPKALIVPHAGYIYSGPTAAAAYAPLAAYRDTIRRVVLLGPVHRVAVRGLALPDCTGFATPLGTVALDRAAIAAIDDLPQVVTSAAAHAWEHSLEVQLPFLQQTLGDFSLLPLAVGDASAAQVAEVLERVWGGRETLILISSDLSHFHDYEQARALDGDTVERILALDATLDHAQACGGTPINGLLLAACRRSLRVQLLDRCNSGDTAGDRARVVGYAAFALFESTAEDVGHDRRKY